MFRYFKRCLDTNLTLKSSLISLQSLLQSPEPSDPQDAEVAKHYLSNKSDLKKRLLIGQKSMPVMVLMVVVVVIIMVVELN